MTRRVLLGSLVVAVLAVAVVGALVVRTNDASSANSTLPGPFAWLAHTSPPTGWSRLAGSPPLGGLPIPPAFRPAPGDTGTLTAALTGRNGEYVGYLNATPLEGGERLQGWPAFRLDHLREDDAISANADAAIQEMHVGPTVRSCVIDDYVTRANAHHFHEVACLVMQGHAGSVIVAATPAGDPAGVWPLLERAVAAYPAARS
jgi:hypothetical protein